MEEQERHELNLLIELDLYDEVRNIYETADMSNEDKKTASRKAIERFCETYQITDDKDIIHILKKLEQMRQSEIKLKEERKKYDEESR